MKKLALVTGGNRGIGKEICRQLGKKPNFQVLLCSRDPKAGREAANELRDDGCDILEVVQLDVTDPASVEAMKRRVEELSKDKSLDVLINNAGFAFKGDTFGSEEARRTIEVNVLGPMHVFNSLLPLLMKSKEGGRVINVASQVGRLGQVSKPLQEKFSSPSAKVEDVLGLLEDFVESIKTGQHTGKGYSSSMYGMSKLGLQAINRVWARENEGRLAFVVSMCPGWCQTELSSFRGPRTASEGAETAVYLATAPKEEIVNGGFYVDDKLREWSSPMKL